MIGAFIQVNTASRKAKSNPIGYVITERGCWEWVGTTNQYGYGQMWNPKTKKVELAGRMLYEQLIGSIPAGLEIDHLCRNPICVNPSHLEPVTHRENGLRGFSPAAQCARRTQCPRGHDLTDEQNLVPWDKQHGHRKCRTCVNDRAALYRARKLELQRQRRAKVRHA